MNRALAHGRRNARRPASLTHFFVAAAGSSALPCVTAECWLRDDGTEICAPEPFAWRLAWWFWLASLVLILMFMCCGDRICVYWCYTKGSNEDENGAMVVVVDDRELIEPLLSQPLGKGQQQHKKTTRCCKSQAPPPWHVIKPVYRYIDDP